MVLGAGSEQLCEIDFLVVCKYYRLCEDFGVVAVKVICAPLDFWSNLNSTPKQTNEIRPCLHLLSFHNLAVSLESGINSMKLKSRLRNF